MAMTPQQFASALGMLPPGAGAAPPAPATAPQAGAPVLVHVTSAGDRWDLLAWAYYGDASLVAPLIAANPQAPIEAAFEAGRTIYVPILQTPAPTAPDLPPWKQ